MQIKGRLIELGSFDINDEMHPTVVIERHGTMAIRLPVSEAGARELAPLLYKHVILSFEIALDPEAAEKP